MDHAAVIAEKNAIVRLPGHGVRSPARKASLLRYPNIGKDWLLERNGSLLEQAFRSRSTQTFECLSDRDEDGSQSQSHSTQFHSSLSSHGSGVIRLAKLGFVRATSVSCIVSLQSLEASITSSLDELRPWHLKYDHMPMESSRLHSALHPEPTSNPALEIEGGYP